MTNNQSFGQTSQERPFAMPTIPRYWWVVDYARHVRTVTPQVGDIWPRSLGNRRASAEDAELATRCGMLPCRTFTGTGPPEGTAPRPKPPRCLRRPGGHAAVAGLHTPSRCRTTGYARRVSANPAGSCLGAAPAIGPPPGACCFVIRRSPMSVDRATVATGTGEFRHWQPGTVQATPILHGLTGVKQFPVRNRTPQDGSERFLLGPGHDRPTADGKGLSVAPIRLSERSLPANIRNRPPVSFDIARYARLAWTCRQPSQYGYCSAASLRHRARDAGAILPHSASRHCCRFTASPMSVTSRLINGK
jgi:hypothetical protein